MNKEFQKEFRNKRICHTHFFEKKKKEDRKRRKKMAERKKKKMPSPVCGKRTQHFSVSSKQESNK